MRILSGIQPTGALHIGNYFGMMRPAIALQNEGEAFYFIADYHALTSLRIRRCCAKTAGGSRSTFSRADWIRKGGAIPAKSDVPAVTELAWILAPSRRWDCSSAAHSYKDKIARGRASVGRLVYLSGVDGSRHS